MIDQTPVGVGAAERRVGTWVLKGVGLFLLAAVALAVFRPANPNIDYRRPVVISALVVALAAAAILGIVAPSMRRRTRPRSGSPGWRGVLPWVVATTASVAGGLVGYALAQPLRFTYGWDAGVVTGFSRELSGGSGLSDYAQDYLSRYPNNVPVIAMMNLARTIGGPTDADMYTTYLGANAIFLAVTLFAIFVLVRQVRSSGPAFVAQGLVFVLVGCSPWMAVPYTDLPGMPLVATAVTLAAIAATVRPTWSVALVVGAFAASGVAFVVKSTPAVLPVAFGLVLLLMAVAGSAPGRLRVAAALVCGALAFGLTALTSLATADTVARIDRSALDTSRTAPVTWWLANGLTTTENKGRSPYYGAYSPVMVRESMHLSGEELQRWSERRLISQVSDMGPGGILTFEMRKLAFNWGDGMFFAWGAYDYEPKRLHRHDPTSRAFQDWQHARGEHYPLRAALTNGVWLALVAWAGAGLLRSPYRRSLLIVALSVLGIGAFTLVFQGGSRYIFAFSPVVIALAASVAPLPRAGRRGWRDNPPRPDGRPAVMSLARLWERGARGHTGSARADEERGRRGHHTEVPLPREW